MNQIIIDVDHDEDDDQGWWWRSWWWLWVGWTCDGDGLDGRDGGGDDQDGREDGGDDQTAISACLCFNATLTISRNAMVDPTENS